MSRFKRLPPLIPNHRTMIFINPEKMLTKHSFKALMLTVFLFGAAFFPFPANAAESFGPTVKILSYHQYLNGTIGLEATGSATIINNAGEILTNAHVVYDGNRERPFDAFSVCISVDPQKEPDCRFTATLKRYDEKIDLAILNIDSEVVWGAKPASFPFLSYSHGNEPADGDAVTVRGFPANGGATISTTKGQISGYDDVDGYSYFKTDADIDAGNSGGTMLDADGNFVGIPSYLISYYENSGRVLRISEAAKWIDSTQGARGTRNAAAARTLSGQWLQYHTAATTGKISFSTDPKFSASVPAGWDVFTISDSAFLINKSDNKDAVLSLAIASNGYKLAMDNDQRLKVLTDIYGEDALKNHETIQIAGVDAIHFWEDLSDGSKDVISFSYGYKEIAIVYTIPKADKAEVENGVQSFLGSIKFASPNQDDPAPSHKLEVSEYPFTMETPADLRVITDDIRESTLAYLVRDTLTIENSKLYYGEWDGDLTYTMKEGLDYDIEKYKPEGAKVTFQSDELVLDGLPGWIYFYEYDDNGTDRKAVSATVLDPEYELYFEFETDADKFDSEVGSFISSLQSFKSKRYVRFDESWDDIFSAELKGTYNLPYPGADKSGLNDIMGHRYETSIRNLVEMGVISGYPDGTFKPENPVNRAEALKIILQSLRSLQADKGADVFVMPENFSKFSDLTSSDWYATYVAEGVDKGIVSGYPDGTFKGGNTVNLAEALKMTLEAHDASVWEGNSDPWHKKYFDAAYALNLLPQGLTDPAKLLTRAELSYIVDQLVSQ